MSDTRPLQRIAHHLSRFEAPGHFTTKRTRPTDDLRIEVKGVGRLRWPVPRTQAKKLCEIGRPARYGQGEKTILDRSVRDTWEIPKSRVKIDKRLWNQTLTPLLERLRADLGIPPDLRLRADLHSMLVYAPGQFFLPHQDSEKADEMVATLVVTLPSTFKGGELIVEHQGESSTYRGSKKFLSCVAFYADCRHQVRPVKQGYRISLTYNLLLADAEASASRNDARGEDIAAPTLDTLGKILREHFETPLPPRWSQDRNAADRDPPERLVFLLDHRYTERGLDWQRLKGKDAARAAMLRAAAEQRDCAFALALAEVHETWSCFETRTQGYGWREHLTWEWDEDEDDLAQDAPPRDRPDDYDLQDLVDTEIALTHWIDTTGKDREITQPALARVEEEEVCTATPSAELEPHAAEYEGYMGNYGNTMDRWYRRAAIVLWPRERDFEVRGAVLPAWALGELHERLRHGDAAKARDMAASLATFWRDSAPKRMQRGFFARVLRVAHDLDDPKLAASLLATFQFKALTSACVPPFLKLVNRYGEDWTVSRFADWRENGEHFGSKALAGIETLPRLCEALIRVEESLGKRCGAMLWKQHWISVKKRLESALKSKQPSQRDTWLAKLARPTRSMLESAERIGADGPQDDIQRFLLAEERENLLPCLMQMLRNAAKSKARKGSSPGLEAIRRHCARLLSARLAASPRGADDWSIELRGDCDCDLCDTLRDFLADPVEQCLEWPIAKFKRMHVHHRIDANELPVEHKTRRKGSPHTLVLLKTKELFEADAKSRRRWEADLAWLEDQ